MLTSRKSRHYQNERIERAVAQMLGESSTLVVVAASLVRNFCFSENILRWWGHVCAHLEDMNCDGRDVKHGLEPVFLLASRLCRNASWGIVGPLITVPVSDSVTTCIIRRWRSGAGSTSDRSGTANCYPYNMKMESTGFAGRA